MKTETAKDEGWSDERLLVKRIWSRAYLDTEEKHIGLLKEYADQQVNKVLGEAIEKITRGKFQFGEVMKVLNDLKIKQP